MAVGPPCRRQSFTLDYFAGPSRQSSFEKLPRDNRSGPPLDARRRAASTSRQKRRRRSPSRQSSWAKQSRMEAFRRRSEEHTSELQSLMRISYAVFCLKKKTPNQQT